MDLQCTTARSSWHIAANLASKGHVKLVKKPTSSPASVCMDPAPAHDLEPVPPAGLDGPLSALARPSASGGWPPIRGLERRHLLGGALLTIPACPAGLACLQGQCRCQCMGSCNSSCHFQYMGSCSSRNPGNIHAHGT